MTIFSSDISRLIHHHLVKEGYEKSANDLIGECPHLKSFMPVYKPRPYKLPRLLGPSLEDLLESYFETKDFVIEELNLLKSAVFKEHDSLPNLIKILVNLKSQSEPNPAKEMCDASTKTDNEENTSYHASYHSTKGNSQLHKDICDASVNTDWMPSSQVLNEEEKKASPGKRSMSERETTNQTQTAYFAPLYDAVEEKQDFQEKIGENDSKETSISVFPKHHRKEKLATSEDLNAVIKAIATETHIDPSFDKFLEDCVGKDIFTI